MSLLDDARRLADQDPVVADICFACGGYNDHYDDCPWLAMPKIVAALEAAERFMECQGSNDDREWAALAEALDA